MTEEGDEYSSSLKFQGVAVGITSGAVIPAFEIFTNGQGIISILSGAGSLGYGIYKYYKDSQVVDKKRNFGDTIADFFDIGVDTAESATWGINHIYLIGAIAGSGLVLYLMSGMIKVQPTTISSSSVPAIVGSLMGIGGGVLLFLDGESVEGSNHPDAPHTIAHDIVNGITGLIPKSNAGRIDISLTTQIAEELAKLRKNNPNDPKIQELLNRVAMLNAYAKANPGLSDADYENYWEYNTQSKAYHFSDSFAQWMQQHPNADQSQIETARKFYSS